MTQKPTLDLKGKTAAFIGVACTVLLGLLGLIAHILISKRRGVRASYGNGLMRFRSFRYSAAMRQRIKDIVAGMVLSANSAALDAHE